MKTERLFDHDPYKKDFEARIIARKRAQEKEHVVLDRTLFYPTSGGQPCDGGSLEGLAVVDVIEEGEVIVHVVEGVVGDKETIRGEIDWDRRFDHMQQHTGQHILSQAFLRIARAETNGFHLGNESSTIDLNVAEITAEMIDATESQANAIIYENRDVIVRRIPSDEIHTVSFRKKPIDATDIRVVEIDGFDSSGCCGTHVRRTGELGLIKVTRWERYKGGSRISFLCGLRALRDYQKKTEALRDVCQTMTAGEEDAALMVRRWKEERKDSAKRIRSLMNDKLELEASSLWENAEQVGSYRIVSMVFEDRDPDEVQHLVNTLARKDDVVTLMGVKHERAHVFIGRSNNVEIDVRPWFEQVCPIIDGRGGGSPSMARGSGEKVAEVGRAIEKAKALCLQEIS